MSEFHARILWWLLLLATTSTQVAVAWIYLRGWHALQSAFPNLIAGWRLAAFLSGLILVWLAIGSPLATLDHQLLTIHMLKHLLLMTVAAPLILVGAPMFTMVCGLPRFFMQTYPPLGSLLGRWLERCVRHPMLCWLAGTVAVVGWHVPGAFQLGMRSSGMHILEDLSFLVAGLLFWWPIVQSPPRATRSPRWSMPLYLFLATLPCDVLSAFLVFCNRLVYPFYLSKPRQFNVLPLADQECAGALMWVWVTFAYLIPAVSITMQLLSPADLQGANRSMRLASSKPVGRSANDAEAEGEGGGNYLKFGFGGAHTDSNQRLI
jgi:cytochrome c oxidase assembly factor CtaG